MAKKKVKKETKVEKVDKLQPAASKPESQLEFIERELNDLFKGLSLVNSRIDRIVSALGQSKSVKNL